MDVSEYILSAGRAVLDIVEREWQPLSPAELEQRLDQAVEEILEAELINKLKSQPLPAPPAPSSSSAAAIYVQLMQDQANVQPQVLQTTSAPSPAEEENREVDPAETAAVKVNKNPTNTCETVK